MLSAPVALSVVTVVCCGIGAVGTAGGGKATGGGDVGP